MEQLNKTQDERIGNRFRVKTNLRTKDQTKDQTKNQTKKSQGQLIKFVCNIFGEWRRLAGIVVYDIVHFREERKNKY